MNASLARRRAIRWMAALLLLLLSAASLPAARAQTDARYSRETGHYLRGAFRYFWDTRGGLQNFGFPITEEFVRKSDGRIVQYFERARFELEVRGNQAIVNLGRLGAEVTGGKTFPRTPPFTSSAARRYFPETQHSLTGAFKATWDARGGAAIFGLPISEEITEQLADGSWRLVQYFERARFELWPSGVRLGLLGRDLAPRQLLAPWPPNAAPSGPLSEDGKPAAPAAPPPALPAPPPNPNARLSLLIHTALAPRGPAAIVPLAAPPGIGFTFSAWGYDPNERVGVWVTRPNRGAAEEVDPRLVTPDGRGGVKVIFTPPEAIEGVWGITAQGVTTGRAAIAWFKVTRDYVAPPGTPRPANHSGSATPAEGGLGTVFRLTGTGFRANEPLELWITSPDGTYTLTAARADARGRVGYAPGLLVRLGAQNPPGVYGYHYRGTRSGTRVDLYFTFTGK